MRPRLRRADLALGPKLALSGWRRTELRTRARCQAGVLGQLHELHGAAIVTGEDGRLLLCELGVCRAGLQREKCSCCRMRTGRLESEAMKRRERERERGGGGGVNRQGTLPALDICARAREGGGGGFSRPFDFRRVKDFLELTRIVIL